MKRRIVRTLSLAAMIAAVTVIDDRAGEIGHFNGGFLNIRDYVMPDPGFYGAVYNYFYTTGQLGLTYFPWVLSVNLHGFYEYFAEARFQGGSFEVSIAKTF